MTELMGGVWLVINFVEGNNAGAMFVSVTPKLIFGKKPELFVDDPKFFALSTVGSCCPKVDHTKLFPF